MSKKLISSLVFCRMLTVTVVLSLLVALSECKVIRVPLESTSFVAAASVNGSELLSNFQNEYYIGTVKIGTPQQNLVVAFDTMSSNFWVPSVICLTCVTGLRYNSAASSSYVQNGTSFTTNYGTTVLQGIYDNDNVTVGGIEIQKATFAEGRLVTGTAPQFMEFGGIFGLGFPGAAYNNVTPPVFQMIEKGLISEPVFSIYFGRNTSQSPGGVILFGGIDYSRFQGNISYIPIKSFKRSDGSEYMNYWQFPMESGKVRGASFCNGGCQVIIASMESGILGPQADITTILNAIGVSSSSLSVNCNSISKYPNVTLTIAGLNYTLTANDYVISFKGQCSIGFGVNTQDNNTWLLGNVFLARFYTIFDIGNMSIGLTGAGGGAESCKIFGSLLLLSIFVKMFV